ncbi:hypothetical protein BZA70DRAFT_271234 [Myxozyma melibiosi]|uniref:Secreted protein n=1 Tax=Myxozyma melibiosi TaxID=54550 RepID=A0ABR1FC33_9ASCO
MPRFLLFVLSLFLSLFSFLFSFIYLYFYYKTVKRQTSVLAITKHMQITDLHYSKRLLFIHELAQGSKVISKPRRKQNTHGHMSSYSELPPSLRIYDNPTVYIQQSLAGSNRWCCGAVRRPLCR